MHYFFLLITLILLPQLNAQQCNLTLSGTISDIHNEAPIASVSVYLKEIQRTTQTDSLGRYTFNNLSLS